MFGSKTAAPAMPELTDFVPYRDFLARQEKLTADLRAVTRELFEVTAALTAEFGDAPAFTDTDLEALVLAGGDGAAGVRNRELLDRHRDLSNREAVLWKAVALLDGQTEKAMKAAQAALAPVAFRDHYRPAVKAAGAKLLEAARELQSLKDVQHALVVADLDAGPNLSMPLPLHQLDKFLDPAEIVDAMHAGNIITDSEAAEYRRQFRIA